MRKHNCYLSCCIFAISQTGILVSDDTDSSDTISDTEDITTTGEHPDSNDDTATKRDTI